MADVNFNLSLGHVQSAGHKRSPALSGPNFFVEGGAAILPWGYTTLYQVPLYLNPNLSFHVVNDNTRGDWYTAVGTGLDIGLGIGGRATGFALGLHGAFDKDLSVSSDRDVTRAGIFFKTSKVNPDTSPNSELFINGRAGVEFFEDGSKPLFLSINVGWGPTFY